MKNCSSLSNIMQRQKAEQFYRIFQERKQKYLYYIYSITMSSKRGFVRLYEKKI